MLTGTVAVEGRREQVPARQEGSRRRLYGVLTIAIPALLGGALTLYALTSRSLWLDETATISIASQHGSALWAGIAHDGGNMLVYYALLHVLMSIFGTSVFVVRLPSVFATALTAGAVAEIGRRLFGRRIGLTAGLLAAVSLPIVYWGQNARAYSFIFAFVATSYLGFVALVGEESRRRPGRPPLYAAPLYVASLVLATYMSFIALLVVPAQLLALYWYRRRIGAVIGSLVVVGLFCAPLVPIARHRGAGQLFWVPKPNFGAAGSIYQAITSSALTPNFSLTSWSLPLLSLTTIALCYIGYRVVVVARRHPEGHYSRRNLVAVLLAGWLFVPTVLDFAESVVGQSIFQSRYLLISAPAVAIILAWGIWAIPFPRAGLARYGAPGLLGLLLVLRGLQILPTYGQSPENWRAAARYVLERAEPGDCIAFYPSDGRMAFDYYLRSGDGVPSAVPAPVLPSLPFSKVQPFVEVYKALTPAEVDKVASSCGRLWLVSSHIGGIGLTARSALHYDRYESMLSLLGLSYPQQIWAHFGYASRINVGLFGSHLGSDKASLEAYLSYGP